MPVTMYKASVPRLDRALRNLSAILDKAQKHASERKIDPQTLLSMRLYPDMFPLIRQVQISTDFAKSIVFRLTGREPPKWDDTEKSFDELQQRIDKAVKLLGTVSPADLDGSETRQITITLGGRLTMEFTGDDYLFNFAMPNFYFHVTTAYGILRHAGVELGKADFIGPFMR